MAKPTAPLLSFGARGKIADTIVYASWRGQAYARRYLIPANPNSTAQQSTRNCFSWLSSVWKVAPPLFQAPWDRAIVGKPLTNRNQFIKSNLPVLRGDTDLVSMVGSPGAFGGLPPVSAVVTPGVGSLTVDVTVPTVLPTGWTIAAAVVAAIEDQSPETGTLYTVTAGEDTTTTYQVVLSSLNSNLYRVFAWLRWTRPDGSIAYSPSIITSGTPT